MANRNEHTTAGGEPSRGNILDFFIVLLLLASIVGIFYRYYALSDLPDTETVEVEISFTAKEIDESLPHAFGQQATVYLPDGTRLGKLADCSGDVWSDTAFAVTSSVTVIDGIATIYPQGTLVDITGKIVASGTNGASGFLLGGILPLTPGQTVTLCSDTGVLTVVVVKISSK